MQKQQVPDKKSPTEKKPSFPEILQQFDRLSNDVLLDANQTSAIIGVSKATLKLWRQKFQNGEELRGPQPLIVGGALVRYRSGSVRDWLRNLATQHRAVSTRGRRLIQCKFGANSLVT
jgi:hypothetical protein